MTCLPYDDRVEMPEGTIADIADPGAPDHGRSRRRRGRSLLGVNEVVVRERDDVEVLARLPQDQGGHPLLVVGRFGKGRTAAWTSDIGPHWLSPSFCDWDGYGKLWKNILGWITAE